MFRSKERLSSLLLAALILLVAGVFALAQRHFMGSARPEVILHFAGSVQRDSKIIPLEKSTVANPGEIVNWTINGENNGTAAALDYKTVSHIPRGTEFVAGSAAADGAKTAFSIDGGKSYSPQPMIEEKQVDGSTKRVPAPVSVYTEIRYEWADPLAPGGKLTASYKVRVK